jgi:hypothetical protein
MDGHRLDGFARRFALSRRGALRALAGGAAAAALGLADRAPALAKPHPKDCQAFCRAVGLSGAALGRCQNDCAQGATTGLYAACGGIAANLCPTPAGPVCYDLQADPNHCGSCDHACGAPQTACVAGVCACPPEVPDFCDLGAGDQRCVDTQTDPNFCGGCHNVCVDPGFVCVAGQCRPPACGGDPFRVCLGASGTFCCPEGQACDKDTGSCNPCESGTATWCVQPGACTGPGTTADDIPCSPPLQNLTGCTQACAYWEVAYICVGSDTFPGRTGCCTPGVDCPGFPCLTGTDDPGYVPCPTEVICAGVSGCKPPSA